MASLHSTTDHQPDITRRHQCPERVCRITCKRRSDLERHRKTAHGRVPTLGDGRIYRCCVQGCDIKRNRLDHFKIHVKRAHSHLDVEHLARQSAVLLDDSIHANGQGARLNKRQSSATTAVTRGTCTGRAVLPVDESLQSNRSDASSDLLTDSGIGLPAIANAAPWLSRAVMRTSEESIPEGSRDVPRVSTKAGMLLTGTLVSLLRRLQAKQLHNCQPSRLHDAETTLPYIEYDDCDAPLDGDNHHHDKGYVRFSSLSSGQGQGYGHIAWPSNGGPGFERGGRGHGDFEGSEVGPEDISDGPVARWPCVFCRFRAREDDPTRDCCTRKKYISLLWPHHYRVCENHPGLFYCWKCFTRFNTRSAMEQHPRRNCEPVCVRPGCPNYDLSNAGRIHCQHGSYRDPLLIWQRLYRIAHGLSVDDWVPDPTRDPQDPPPLPSYHPLFENFRQDEEESGVPANGSALVDHQQPENLFGGAGGWMPLEQLALPQSLPNLPTNTSTSPTDRHSRLIELLLNLWESLNVASPALSSFTANMYYAVVRQPYLQPRLQGTGGLEEEVVTLEILAGEYLRLINNPNDRSLRQWREVARMTRGIIGNYIETPHLDHCPWHRVDSPQAGPSQQRIHERPQAIDPDPAMWNPAPLPTINTDMDIPDGVNMNEESISQAAFETVNNFTFLAAPQTPQTPHYARSEPPMDRRPSLGGSWTSPSDAIYHTPRTSFNGTPSHDSFGPLLQRFTTAPVNLSEFIHVDEDEGEGELDEMD